MKKLNLKLEDNIDVYGLIEVLEKEDFFGRKIILTDQNKYFLNNRRKICWKICENMWYSIIMGNK